MSKENSSATLAGEGGKVRPLSPAHARWLADLGEATESVAHMMRKPTDVRPFVYEVRFDLIPAKNSSAVLVAKGFGADGSICSFVNASGFIQLLRVFEGQLKAGKTKWYQDTFPPTNYDKRLARYNTGEFYKV